MKLKDLVREDLDIISKKFRHDVLNKISKKYNNTVRAALVRYMDLKANDKTVKNPLAVAAKMHGIHPRALEKALDDFNAARKTFN